MMIRLGFAVRTVGRPGLAGGAPAHLSVALAQLGDLLGYLAQLQIRFYRMALPAGPLFGQIAECAAQLDLLAERLAAGGVRVGIHLDPQLSLAGADDRAAAVALAEVEAAAALLAALDARRPGGQIESTLVIHAGGAGGDAAALQRLAARRRALSAAARARLAIEHSGGGHSLGALLRLAARGGAPVIFDSLHFALHNPERMSLPIALGLSLATWPAGVRPEVHLSSQRSEAHLLPAAGGAGGRVLAPRPGQHADFVVAQDLIALLSASRGLPPFDLMVEAKAGELALLRLRAEVGRLAPELASRLA